MTHNTPRTRYKYIAHPLPFSLLFLPPSPPLYTQPKGRKVTRWSYLEISLADSTARTLSIVFVRHSFFLVFFPPPSLISSLSRKSYEKWQNSKFRSLCLFFFAPFPAVPRV